MKPKIKKELAVLAVSVFLCFVGIQLLGWKQAVGIWCLLAAVRLQMRP